MPCQHFQVVRIKVHVQEHVSRQCQRIGNDCRQQFQSHDSLLSGRFQIHESVDQARVRVQEVAAVLVSRTLQLGHGRDDVQQDTVRDLENSDGRRV